MSQPVIINSARPRQAAPVNSRLEKNLAAYLMAGAAGVTLLAAQVAEAKIVYTPKHVVLGPESKVPLDLANNGVVDFVLSRWFYGQAEHLSMVAKAPTNEAVATNGGDLPAALPAGVQIGPARRFARFDSMATQWSASGVSTYGGVWKNAEGRYLGLKFSLNGETHYGWARMTVTAKGGILATLTGYAYETVPNQPILAGETSGPESASAVEPGEMLAPSQPATLGMLARGADFLPIWRRNEEAIAQRGW
jgi:hypothetical protein